jgi:hypothetical protein
MIWWKLSWIARMMAACRGSSQHHVAIAKRPKPAMRQAQKRSMRFSGIMPPSPKVGSKTKDRLHNLIRGAVNFCDLCGGFCGLVLHGDGEVIEERVNVF